MAALCGAVCCSDGVLTVGSLAPQCETHIRLACAVRRPAEHAFPSDGTTAFGPQMADPVTASVGYLFYD